MIRIERLTKSFPSRKGLRSVIRDATLTIESGVNVGVIGRNGAGKSTLLRLISGVDIPNSGRIIREGSVSWPVGLTSCLQRDLTGRENVRFACRIQGLHRHEMQPHIDFVESFVEFGDDFDNPVASYSSGMRARLNFAITMSFDFDHFVMDEVSAMGDLAFRQKVVEMIKTKHEGSPSFIIASHDLDELTELCQAGVLIHAGKVQYWSSMRDAIDCYKDLVGRRARPSGAEDKTEAKRGKRRRRRRGSVEAGAPATTDARPGTTDSEPSTHSSPAGDALPTPSRKSPPVIGRIDGRAWLDGMLPAPTNGHHSPLGWLRQRLRTVRWRAQP